MVMVGQCRGRHERKEVNEGHVGSDKAGMGPRVTILVNLTQSSSIRESERKETRENTGHSLDRSLPQRWSLGLDIFQYSPVHIF